MNVSEMNEFVFLWKEYGIEENKWLTSDAQILKKKLRDYVRKLPKFEELKTNDTN